MLLWWWLWWMLIDPGLDDDDIVPRSSWCGCRSWWCGVFGFCQVFVQPDGAAEGAGAGGPSEGANAQFVAKNLVNLVNESKMGELASLEELVSSLVKDMLDKDNKDAALDPEVCIVCLVEQ